jgi:hypothetical protein
VLDPGTGRDGRSSDLTSVFAALASRPERTLVAARKLEVLRISHALRRAEALPSDVAAAIEGEA